MKWGWGCDTWGRKCQVFTSHLILTSQTSLTSGYICCTIFVDALLVYSLTIWGRVTSLNIHRWEIAGTLACHCPQSFVADQSQVGWWSGRITLPLEYWETVIRQSKVSYLVKLSLLVFILLNKVTRLLIPPTSSRQLQLKFKHIYDPWSLQ